MNKETKKVLFVLLNEYTDWEGAFLSTALHVGVIPDRHKRVVLGKMQILV